MGKRRDFRQFPKRLPQAWMALSHGAQGMAFHWWLVFEDEPVTVPVDRLAAAIGIEPRSRRYVVGWVAELLSTGALRRDQAGILHMPALLQVNGERTVSERSVNGQQTVSERSANGERTVNERSMPGKTAESLTPKATEKPLQTDRQTDRQGERPTLHPLRLKPILEECVRTEFGKRDVPRQGASVSQWEEACRRVHDALADGHGRFGDPQAACQALAVAAVAESLKPGGKLGFALLQAPFVSASPEKPAPIDLRPKIFPKDRS